MAQGGLHCACTAYKRESIGSTLPTHWVKSALLTSSTVGSILTSSHITVGNASIQTCGTTLKSTKISTASCLCGKPTRSPWTFTQPMADNYMWAVQCMQRGRGVTISLVTFTQPMADNYMWAVQCIRGATISPVIASKGIETTLSGPGSISSSQRQKILSRIYVKPAMQAPDYLPCLVAIP